MQKLLKTKTSKTRCNTSSIVRGWLIVLCISIVSIAKVHAQNIDIKGVVTEAASGATIPGVNITLEGTTVGVISGANGEYKIQVPSANSTLVFSFIGYLTEKMPVNGKSQIDITLTTDVKVLDEVVVVGYGIQKKRDLTGAISSVKGDELRKIPVSTAAEALIGKVAGVQIVSSEGSPGADIKIRVRGGGSITQDNSPLYIIDGFPSNEGLTSVDPSDIESIDVLKDASSTAIYGARGANGVVIITTKGGKSGRTSVSYDGYYGLKKLPAERKFEMFTPYEFVLAQYENAQANSVYQNSFLLNYGKWDDLYPTYIDQQGIDWQNETFGRTAKTISNNININGGNEKTRFNLGFSRNDEEGILIESGYSRNLIKFKLDHKATDKLTVGFNMNYSERDIKGGKNFGRTGRLANALLYRPTSGILTDLDLVSSDYDPAALDPDNKNNNLTNPVLVQKSEYLDTKTKSGLFNGSIDYDILKGLTFRVAGGLSFDNIRDEQFTDERSRAAQQRGGAFGSIGNTENRRWINTNLLTYKNKINEHDFSIMAGNEQVGTVSKMFIARSGAFPNSDIGLGDLGQGAIPDKPASSASEDRLVSYFGRANYSFKGKYLFSATVRTDGSSKFGPENRYATFPSVSLGWRMSDEEFISKLNIFSNLKLRASYGESGNNRIDNDLFSGKFSSTFYGINNSLQNAVFQNSLPNPKLKWETTVSRNLGLDFGFFDNRISIVAEGYKNTTKDLLLNAKIPPSAGYSTQIQNIGSTQNIGLEFTVNTVNISTPNFRWTSDFNISFNRSKVMELSTGNNMEYFLAESRWQSSTTTLDYMVKVGEPVGLMYGFETDGFYKVEDFDYDATKKSYTIKPGIPYVKAKVPQPGDLKLKDLDGENGEMDANGTPLVTADGDRTTIGNANPKHFGGFNNTFSYKGLDISIFINWSYGNDIYNANKIRFTSNYAYNQNSLAVMRERWMTVNGAGVLVTDPTELAELNKDAKIWKINNDIGTFHSWAVEDGSFIRINNITLGYTLPKSLLKKVKINNLRFYATVYNVWLFTNYSGYDPDVDTRSSNSLTPGLDYSAYPRSRSVIFGVNLTL